MSGAEGSRTLDLCIAKPHAPQAENTQNALYLRLYRRLGSIANHFTFSALLAGVFCISTAKSVVVCSGLRSPRPKTPAPPTRDNSISAGRTRTEITGGVFTFDRTRLCVAGFCRLMERHFELVGASPSWRNSNPSAIAQTRITPLSTVPRGIYARISLITVPPTSVRRKSRPLKRYVSRSWFSPARCKSVACKSLTWTLFVTAL